MALRILEKHRAENDGAWPETVAVMLWGLDAIKTRGESLAILLELVGRVSADPAVLLRTPAFGVDYVAFASLCPPDCDLELLLLPFTCCLVSRSHSHFYSLISLSNTNVPVSLSHICFSSISVAPV